MMIFWYIALATWIVLCVCAYKFFDKINRWLLVIALIAPFVLYAAIPKVRVVEDEQKHHTKYMFSDYFTTDNGQQHKVEFFEKYLYNHSSHRLKIRYVHYGQSTVADSFFPNHEDKVEVGGFKAISDIDYWFENASSFTITKKKRVTKTELFYDN